MLFDRHPKQKAYVLVRTPSHDVFHPSLAGFWISRSRNLRAAVDGRFRGLIYNFSRRRIITRAHNAGGAAGGHRRASCSPWLIPMMFRTRTPFREDGGRPAAASGGGPLLPPPPHRTARMSHVRICGERVPGTFHASANVCGFLRSAAERRFLFSPFWAGPS